MYQAEWMAEIGKAADELGLGILELEPGRIRFRPARRKADVTVTVESVFLSGDLLRSLVRPTPTDLEEHR